VDETNQGEYAMKIITYWCDISQEYGAYDEDSYCGCIDCLDLIGYGRTKQEAEQDLIQIKSESSVLQ
jgi:hypothetical protein